MPRECEGSKRPFPAVPSWSPARRTRRPSRGRVSGRTGMPYRALPKKHRFSSRKNLPASSSSGRTRLSSINSRHSLRSSCRSGASPRPLAARRSFARFSFFFFPPLRPRGLSAGPGSPKAAFRISEPVRTSPSNPDPAAVPVRAFMAPEVPAPQAASFTGFSLSPGAFLRRTAAKCPSPLTRWGQRRTVPRRGSA